MKEKEIDYQKIK